jgi:hypothetical protein
VRPFERRAAPLVVGVGGRPGVLRRGEPMSNSLEALKLISDWGKWLITIETAAIAVIGGALASKDRPIPKLAKVFATSAVGSFLISIVAAAMLLLTLPEIAQSVREGENIWLTEDSVAGRLLGMNTQDFALVESLFFACGMVLFVAMIVAIVWAPSEPPVVPIE